MVLCPAACAAPSGVSRRVAAVMKHGIHGGTSAALWETTMSDDTGCKKCNHVCPVGLICDKCGGDPMIDDDTLCIDCDNCVESAEEEGARAKVYTFMAWLASMGPIPFAIVDGMMHAVGICLHFGH